MVLKKCATIIKSYLLADCYGHLTTNIVTNCAKNCYEYKYQIDTGVKAKGPRPNGA